ncbi:MAG: PadR family transcriptional regulator [Actinomycetota bacterium]|nr:PadR family transcriptional regulator [Actinomycetota bacterium]
MSVPKRSPIAVAVLALLAEAPMHPYRMQALIAERGKDEVINVSQRASLYNTIDRLSRDGLVRVRETIREGHRPERSVYEITAEGRKAAAAWMGEMLSAPRREYPEFPAALAHLPLLEPASAAEYLRIRRAALGADVERLSAGISAVQDTIPRLFLLDAELNLQVNRTELAWLDGLIDDLTTGAMTWSRESLQGFAHKLETPEDLESRKPEDHEL